MRTGTEDRAGAGRSRGEGEGSGEEVQFWLQTLEDVPGAAEGAGVQAGAAVQLRLAFLGFARREKRTGGCGMLRGYL